MSTSPLRPRLALLGATLLVCLALAELTLRALAPPAELRGLHAVHPEQRWLYGLAPGAEATALDGVHYRINADGFRDREYAHPKPSDVFRIIVLGDSVSFGFGVPVERSFPKQMETLLSVAERDPVIADRKRIEVLNFGVNGYSPYNEAALLAGRGADFEPDLVLVQFCINDLNDPTLHFAASAQLAIGSLPEAAYPDPALRREPSTLEALCRRSAVCERALAWRLGGVAAPWDERERSAAYRPRSHPRYATEWRWLEARYREMAASAATLDAPFAVLEIPYRDQLRDPRDMTTALLKSVGERNGWPVFSALGAFRAASRSGPAAAKGLFIDLWHPSAAGHDVAAASLARALRCSSLLPAGAQLSGKACD